MPIAARHRTDPVPTLAPLADLVVRRETDAEAMAVLQNRTREEMARRFDQGHRAYVALLRGAPAGWGWVATRTASIGEVGAAFTVPRTERYLWNFVTLPAYRGGGIYPRLLDAIVRAESREAERFWIAYAPENRASGSGIRKAGFVTIAALSFAPGGAAALESRLPGGADAAARVFGLPIAREPLAPCWRCVRAGGSSDASCGRCQCDYQRPDVLCAA
jgi:GNAT superfamily N-acetyltransferase